MKEYYFHANELDVFHPPIKGTRIDVNETGRHIYLDGCLVASFPLSATIIKRELVNEPTKES